MSSTHSPRQGKQVGDHFPTLTSRFEIPFGTHDPATSTLALSTEGWNINGLAVETVQLGFVVKRVDLAGTAVHEEENDAPSLGRMGEEWTVQIGCEIWGKTMSRLGSVSYTHLTLPTNSGV